MTKLERWLSEQVTPLGFSRVAGDDRLLFDRPGFITPTIGLYPSSLHRGRLVVSLGNSVANDLEPPEGNPRPGVLSYQLGKNGIHPVEWNHAEPWPEAERSDMEAAIKSEGIEWLDYFCDPLHLVHHLEGCLDQGLPSQPPDGAERTRLRDRLLFRQHPVKLPTVRRPPIYKLFIALIYDHLGRSQDALKYLTHVVEQFVNVTDPLDTRRLENYRRRIRELQEG